ncbi:MAG TPA: toll/interleukin-1 receptor domain-containing protein [Candidatus Kapabacteria bacterium]|jgi:hypothetical protein|nr:toll/interleukin-1 receptor domain-containing protein [Candidatus Kapabacteria bacterium]
MRNSKKVFVCYSHRDSRWLKWLDPILKPLVREGAVEEWSDRKIDAGQKWKDEIRNALESSGIAILIISQDFLASDFIFTDELPPILEAEQEDGLRLLCLYVRPCDIASFPKLLEFQAINDPQKPLAEISVSARDRIGIAIADSIRQYQTWTKAGDQVENSPATITSGVDDEEKGFLEYKADSNEAMTSMTSVLTDIAKLTSSIGEKFNARQESLNNMIARGEDNAQLAVNIVNASAMDLNGYSEQLEKVVPVFEDGASKMHDNLIPWLSWRKENGHTSDNDGFANSLRGMVESAGPSTVKMESFRDSVLGMKGASKPMNHAVTRSRSILDRLITTMKKVQTDSKEYLTLLN